MSEGGGMIKNGFGRTRKLGRMEGKGVCGGRWGGEGMIKRVHGLIYVVRFLPVHGFNIPAPMKAEPTKEPMVRSP